MAIIEVSLNHPIWDGEEIRFKASCDSSSAAGLKVTYPVDEESGLQSKTLAFKDAHGANISSTANLFSNGSYVTAVVDATGNAAYIQNADTNNYLEGKTLVYTSKTVAKSSWVSSSTYSDFPYRASVSCSGVTSKHVPSVVYSPADALSGNFAPVAQSYSGGVYIYASAVPDSSITLQTIICFLGKGA